MDDAVLACVIGRPVAARDKRPASLLGFRRVHRLGASYPILLPEADGVVEGILVEGLDDKEGARLIAFEGEDYWLASRPVRPRHGRMVEARLFLPRPTVAATPIPWRFDVWRRRFARAYRRRVGANHGPT